MKSKKKLIKEINKNLEYIHATLKKKNKKKAKAKRWAKKNPPWKYFTDLSGKRIKFESKGERDRWLRKICAAAAKND